MDQEFENIDSSGQWQNLYNEIRNQSQECPYKVAKFPENRNRNRYRDVSPCKFLPCKPLKVSSDLMCSMEERQPHRGPLRNTCGHFWQMIWEQRCKAVIMLNRVIEKGSEKCAQYWPSKEERDMDFIDTGFMVTLVCEDAKPNYKIRLLELKNGKTGETREIYHFHYTTWPDFGVPESPASFLNFLFQVRESGSLGPENGPAVVHCSAGIGRSGTFSLVDTCLDLMDKRKDPSSVDIQKILLDMREYRMGLIQTPDQLRFSYMAVMEGAKSILGNSALQSSILSSEKLNGQSDSCSESHDPGREQDGIHSPKEEHTELKTLSLCKLNREERIASTAQRVQHMKLKLSDSEKTKEKWLFWKPILLNVGAGAAVALGLCMCWAFLSQ
uniref:Tyrosine-protein phosphatase non-receptor type n=1 Tax=Sinocyclocheilus grahami TaxID=75366 RepID=A0A672PQG0_SINGR